MKKYNLIIPSDLHGFRLDKALDFLIADYSRTKIQQALKEGNVKVNEVIISVSTFKVKENDAIDITLSEPPILHMQATEIELNIIYEDDDLIVINKPVGLTVHPGVGNHQNTLANALLYHSKQLSDINGEFRPGIVHRLDKDTSGLMVVAKTNLAHVNLAEQINDRSLVRKYKALVWGVLQPKIKTIKTNIGRHKTDRLKMTVLKFGGKPAVTHCRVEEILINGLMSIVECKLETGRTHQIRVHLSHIGHSIVGDRTYGHNSRKIAVLPENYREAVSSFKRQALHSRYLAFTHPVSGKYLEFEIDWPQDIKELVEVLSL